MRQKQYSSQSSQESFPVTEVLHLDVYHILKKHQGLGDIQSCDFLNSEPFEKVQRGLADPSVHFSLVRCLCNSSEEGSGYLRKVEVELVRHGLSIWARSNKSARSVVCILDLRVLLLLSDDREVSSSP